MVTLKDLMARAGEYLPPASLSIVEKAYHAAAEMEKPDLPQALETAMVLVSLQMDAESLAASLLLGLPSDHPLSRREVENKFGDGIKKLVNGVNKVNSISWLAPDEAQSERLRRMFLAMVEDVRVIIISLAHRLQVMRNLKKLPPEERQNIAQETMEVYAPLAHRLGIGELRQELDDLAFYYRYPEEYREIASLLDVRKTEWERYITHAIRILGDEFQKVGLVAEIVGRPKSVPSIRTKMEKYAAQGKEFSDIYDLLAVRVLVNQVSECYTALGIVHQLWRPLPGQFDDYIANPKGNMYQSLHTTVLALDGKPLEIQIRTFEMHRTNEFGVAAHWRYKQGDRADMRFEEKLAWFRQIMEWQKDVSGVAFVESLKTDVFKDQVYVFTPMGEVKELPQGSTPLDFAYRVHTNLGHRCTGAKVNGRLVPLTYQLENGDVVDIVTTKADRGPSLDWLNPESGYVKSGHAREKIRGWFRKRARIENLEEGKSLFDRALKRLGIGKTAAEVGQLFGYDDADEFLIALGCGDISANQIGPKLVEAEARKEEVEVPHAPAAREAPKSTGVQVLGVGDLLTQLAACCTPIPGDDIIGFVTRNRGVSIHRRNCPNMRSAVEKGRIVDVSWGPRDDSYPVPVVITAEDRVGLLKDITTVVTEAKVNIASISSADLRDGASSIFLTVNIPDLGHLGKLLSKLETVKGVTSVGRASEPGKEEKKGKKLGMIKLDTFTKVLRRRR